ncbi:MAG: hypothetical protein IH987_08620 [Planctomycetes bacterium]|nr:hypothetical protein [Planctomycetota bacterium]
MPTTLRSFIRNREIVRSSDLIERMTNAGYSADNARQRMHRLADNSDVWRSEKLQLPGRERLFARNHFRQSSGFVTSLVHTLDTLRPGLARCLRRLIRTRVVLCADLARLSSAAVNGTILRVPTLADVMDALVDSGAFEREAQNTVLDRLTARELVGTDQSGAIAFQEYGSKANENILSKLILDSYRRSNIVSWGGCSVASLQRGYTDFNNQAFSAIAYSYLAPFLRWREGRNRPISCPVLFDVHSRECTVDDVEAFQCRLKRVARGDRSWRLLGLIASPDFEAKAWDSAKRNGFITINLRQMVGDAALEMLAGVEEIVRNLPGSYDRVESADTNRLAECLAQLDKNRFVVELRSIAFETVAALILRSMPAENVEIGMLVPWKKNEQREVDVVGEQEGGEKLYIIECKAVRADKELEPTDVTKFFTQSVPALLKLDRYAGARIVHAEIWTTGAIGSEAKRELRSLALKRKVRAKLRGFDEVTKQLKSKLKRCKRLLNVIRSTKDTI